VHDRRVGLDRVDQLALAVELADQVAAAARGVEVPELVGAEVEQRVGRLALQLLEGVDRPELAVAGDGADLGGGGVADEEGAVGVDVEAVDQPHAGLVAAQAEGPAGLVAAVGVRRCTWRLP
jgi:hypothetical protein